MSGRGAVLACIAGALAVVVSACGIQAEAQPRALPTQAIVPTRSPDPAPSPSPAERVVTLWFTKEGVLVPTQRTARDSVNSQDLIDLLVAGPTADEAAQGLRTAVVSPLTGDPLVETASSAGVEVEEVPATTVPVVLSPDFTELIGDEQVLALGEVVHTLTVGPVESILFVEDDGQRVGVPLPDGRLKVGPVTAEDYAASIG